MANTLQGAFVFAWKRETWPEYVWLLSKLRWRRDRATCKQGNLCRVYVIIGDKLGLLFNEFHNLSLLS